MLGGLGFRVWGVSGLGGLAWQGVRGLSWDSGFWERVGSITAHLQQG